MAAETLTSTQAGADYPVFQSHVRGAVMAAYGTYAAAANVEDGDIFELCKVPKNCVVIGGRLYAGDLDTGTEALDMDLGWAGNGEDAADVDGFGNFGVWSGDVDGTKPEVGNSFPFGGVLMTAGPKAFAAETTIQVEANVAANTWANGTISCVVYYICE